MKQDYIVEFIDVTKKFPGVVANDQVSFKVAKGSIHGLIGENGAGKSTLMSILFGMHEPTSGKIRINGRDSVIQSPNEASDMGIGMVHQHFHLVGIYSNLDNIIMGDEFVNKVKVLDRKAATFKIKSLQNIYNLNFNLKEKSNNASVATQQKVEIMKMLYRDADLLIFDEPTAVLTDEEIQGLLKTFLHFKKMGKTVILISHKMNEIKQVCDSATVLRLGKVVKNYDSLQNVEPAEIARMMVGQTVNLPKNTAKLVKKQPIFEFDKVSSAGHKGVHDISFKIHAGEILAIAGVEGNGQEQIEFLASGLLKPKKGKIFKYEQSLSGHKWITPQKEGKLEMKKVDLTHKSVRKKNAHKINYIPGDRHKYGLVLDFDLIDNSVIRRLYQPETSFLGVLKKKFQQQFSEQIINNFDVRGARHGTVAARALSGGNQQKAIVGREILTEHDVLIVTQPTRGLDVGAINLTHEKILAEREKNKAILLISYELDEIISLADTILVVNKNRVVDIKDKHEITREEIGLMMSGIYDKPKQGTQ